MPRQGRRTWKLSSLETFSGLDDPRIVKFGRLAG